MIAFLARFIAHWAITSIKFPAFFSIHMILFVHRLFFCCRYPWNREASRLLCQLFQMTMTDLARQGAPEITISK